MVVAPGIESMLLPSSALFAATLTQPVYAACAAAAAFTEAATVAEPG